MKNKSKRQKLANNPYLSQQTPPQSQHMSSSALYKINRLNNSMYSPQENHNIPDFQAQNQKLKEQICTIKSESSQKETLYRKQIQDLRKALEEKQNKITQLQQKILDMEKQVQLKNYNLMDRIIQCGDIVKQLEEKELKSSGHNMLQTSRIEKFNILDQTKGINEIGDMQLKSLNSDKMCQFQYQNNSVNQNNLHPLNSRQNLISPGNCEAQSNRIFQGGKNGLDREFLPKRKQSPGVFFSYTPPKTVVPTTATYNRQLNCTVNPVRNIYPINRSLLGNDRQNVGFNNTIIRAISPQNITQVNKVGRPLNMKHLNISLTHKR